MIDHRHSSHRWLRVTLLAILVVGAGCASSERDLSTFAAAYGAGLEAFEARDYELAEQAFGRAIQLSPRHPYPHFYMGVMFADQGKTELAVVALERAVELEPNFHEAMYNLGTVQLERREVEAAIHIFEQVLTVDPDHVPTFNNLAKAYYLAGYPAMAGAAYEEALERDPDNRVALKALAAMARSSGATEQEQQYRSRLDTGKPPGGTS